MNKLKYALPLLLFFGCKVAKDADISEPKNCDKVPKLYQGGNPEQDKRVWNTKLKLHEMSLQPKPDEDEFTKKLRGVDFPDVNSKPEVKKYIKQILALPAGRGPSKRDLQIKLFYNLGEENVDLLINALDQRITYHLVEALRHLVTSEHKKLVLDNLAEKRILINIVIHNGWEQEAKQILVDELKKEHQYLPESWLSTVVGYNDVNTYDDLIHHFIHARNKYSSYIYLRKLKGIDLTAAVKQGWINYQPKRKETHDFLQFIIVALEHGQCDALIAASRAIHKKSKNRYTKLFQRQLVKWLNEHTTFTENITSDGQWISKNIYAIKYNPETKVYEL